jgi:hypothetical protein
MKRQSQNIINANKRRVLRDLMNELRDEPIKSVRGFNKLFGTSTDQTYRIMDALVGTNVLNPIGGFSIDQEGNRVSNDIQYIKQLYTANKGKTMHFLALLTKDVYDTEGEWVDDPNAVGGMKKIYNILLKKGETIIDRTVDIPDTQGKDFSDWLSRELFAGGWYKNSGTTIFALYDVKVYTFEAKSLVNKQRILQSYLDGLSHCVFEPIEKWATEMKEKQDNGSSTVKKYNAVINKIKKLAIEYKDGVPEYKCDEVCEKLNVRIEITYLFTEETTIYGSKLIKPMHTFSFTNTRLNHIEIGHLVWNSKSKEVSYDELRGIVEQYDEQGIFYTYKKSFGKLSCVRTLTEAYSTITQYREAVNALEEKYHMDGMKIDDVTDVELSQFIKRGTHYNCNIAFPNSSNNKNPRLDVKCIDQKKAYYNFQKCKYYEGFLGKITDFRKCNKIMGVGLYLIKDIKISKKSKMNQYNQIMQIYKNNNVYTSAELRMLSDYGFTYTIVAGAYSLNKLEFHFGEEMLNKVAKTPYVDEEGNFSMVGSSFYALCTGSWDSHHTHNYNYMRGTEEDAQLFKNMSKNEVKYDQSGEISVGIPKKSIRHLGHITAFILAYQRISLLMQLMEMDVEKIEHIYTDGIYYREHDFTILDTFGKKPLDTYPSLCFDETSFISNVFDDCNMTFANVRENYHTELFLGAGGNGKTHYNINDTGLVHPIFCAPSHKLNAIKHKECGIRVYTWASLLSKNPMLEMEIKRYGNVLIIDEVSMMSDEEKWDLIEKYDMMKIIMCGDVGYQLPCFSTLLETKRPFRKTGFDNIQTFNTNYRVKCGKLFTLLLHLRDCIDGKSTLDLSCCERVSVSELVGNYKVEDIIICRTHKQKDKWTDSFLYKNKWYITKRGAYHFAGEIIVSQEKPENGEIRHGYTAHSVQGETCENNIYIELNDIIGDLHGLYTAISRAKYLHQIKLVV